MTNKDIAFRLIDLAYAHREKAAMRSSADQCIIDAKNLAGRNEFYYAAHRALRSLDYSLGILSPIHAEARGLALTMEPK